MVTTSFTPQSQTAGGVPDFSGDQRRHDDEYSLGAPAEAVYGREILVRDAVIERARECSRVTIPSLVPPLGYQEGDKLYTPHQGMGARGVNNLASRLLVTLMAPNRPLFKHQPPRELAAEMEAQAANEREGDETLTKINVAFMKRAMHFTERLDTTPLRATVYQTLRLLEVAGNCLFKYHDLDEPTVQTMDKYIVKRNSAGKPLMWIEEEMVSWQALSPDARRRINPDHPKYLEIVTKPSWERVVPVYRVVKLVQKGKRKHWVSWEEVCDQKIDSTKAKHPYESPPSYPMWMVPAYGFDWGRSYVDEYVGDLISVENFSKALNDGAAAAALSLLFVRPGSRTRIHHVKEAKNLDVLTGDAADLSMFRTDKQADFRIVLEVMQETIKRLQFAFLLTSAIQRDGERVTAEEIRIMAAELDEAMGGTYAIFSLQLQGYIVNRGLYMMEKTRELAPLPKLDGRKINVRIITGLDALGDSREGQILDEFAAPFFEAGEVGLRKLNLDEYGRRKAVTLGLDPKGLLVSDKELQDQMQQAQQADMMRTAVEKGIGPAVQAGADAMTQNPDMAQGLASQAQGMDPQQLMAMFAQLQPTNPQQP